MNELIKITTDQKGKEAISSRELHAFLESKQDFSTWIKSRIEKYDFIDGIDFTTILWKSTGGRPSVDYVLTIETAKEIAMVEGNEKGKEARRYFIECEKKFNETIMLSPSQLLLKQAQILVNIEYEQSKIKEEQREIRKEIAEVKAKQIGTPSDYYSIAGFGSLVNKPIDIKTASALGKKATKLCNELGYIMSKIPDPRFGTVKIYPTTVLKPVFEEYYNISIS